MIEAAVPLLLEKGCSRAEYLSRRICSKRAVSDGADSVLVTMNSQDNPLQLAKICLWLARLMKSEDVAAELPRMAKEY